jgi:hypothetical protein
MVSAELANRFAEAGVQLVSTASGRNSFVHELLYGSANHVEILLGGPIPRDHGTLKGTLKRDIYPLLSGATSNKVVRRTDRSVSMVLETTPDRYIFLSDHRLDGKPTMPMTMVLELAAEIASVNWPENVVSRIINLQVLHGIVYGDHETKLLTIEGNCVAEGNTRQVDFSLKAGDSGHFLNYRARIELQKKVLLPMEIGGDPLVLTDQREFTVTLDEVYRSWLFHGEKFAVITGVEAIAQDGIIARLKSSSPKDFFNPTGSGSWLIDPAVIDGGLQLLILWTRLHLDQTGLPSKLGCYHRFSNTITGDVLCHVRIQHFEGDPILRADIKFFDEERRLIGWMENMEVICTRSLNRLALAK